MDSNHLYDELLIKYLSDELSSDEEAVVVQWLEKDEQNKQHLETLKKLLRLTALKKSIGEVDVQKEWNQFKQSVIETHKEDSSAKPYAVKHPVADEADKKGRVYKIVIAVAVAASILLVLGIGWNLWVKNDAPVPTVVKQTEQKDSSAAIVIRHEKNTSGKPERIMLQDGTEVLLSANSTIDFQEPFANNRRDITLSGEAVFKVAKDKSRPFTVYSGDLSTTALGTAFRVSAFEHARSIFIQLLEGKVVVKSVEGVKRKLKKEVYLLPGQQLIYNNRNATAKVIWFTSKDEAKDNISKEQSNDNPSVPREKENWYMFNNQSLDQVFQQLEEMYHAEIIYSKKDVQKMYFIGKFSKRDSLETILSQIATLNHLKVTKENSRFIISK